MNCNQVWAMLAIYRELQTIQTDTSELDTHLERCEVCRQVLARYHIVGEQVRSLATIEPAPDAHAKLMRALAAEHVRFLQRSPLALSQPTPDFLKPYLKEQTQATHALAAFSSAETGPLPISHIRRKSRASYVSQFAIVGLAAVFLMALLVGGLTSLLLLANRGPVNNQNQASIVLQAQVASVQYATTTAYTQVVSAVADRQYIYYTAYNPATARWMLLAMDRTTQVSMPLLAKASTNKLVVLGSNENHLVWLQFDATKTVSKQVGQHTVKDFVVAWHLYSLDLAHPTSQVTLFADTFDHSAVPSWVHTPIQGTWFVQGTLLVALIDHAGKSHLYTCQLASTVENSALELANVSGGHVLTSPTANSDGTVVYWGEEWLPGDGVLRGNVWTQQVHGVQPLSGHSARHLSISRYLVRSDSMSFHPQVAHDTLFLLSTSAIEQPQLIATPTSLPVTATTRDTANFDPTAYTTQIDQSIQGALLALPLNGLMPATLLDNNVFSSTLHGGTRFLLWGSEKGYQMYDAVAKLPVTVYDALKGTSLLTVNGDTAVWTTQPGSVGSNVDNASLIFRAFNWPTKA
ncbi:MAG: hypothetical protein JO125_07660 [Chloroflexi bacterium]|nr:hypothetical protein [Ktedonobacteraceae bacterium]MBV9019853.1 hypothetical protein [Ktedonobacteraceae bacterium]MBV9707269.1 hypothetical protein [Chloroflexota bacterium]